MDMEPFSLMMAGDARNRLKGPPLHCQDKFTAAILKSQGYCAVNFSASIQGPAQCSTHKHTPVQTHTKTEKCDRIRCSFSSEEAAWRKKDGTEGGTKAEHFKKHF